VAGFLFVMWGKNSLKKQKLGAAFYPEMKQNCDFVTRS